MSKCNICNSKIEFYNHKGTHIAKCKTCPNVQIEYYCEEDIKNLKEFLKGEVK